MSVETWLHIVGTGVLDCPLVCPYNMLFAQAGVSETVCRSRCVLIALAVLLRSALYATLCKTSTAYEIPTIALGKQCDIVGISYLVQDDTQGVGLLRAIRESPLRMTLEG